MELAASTDLGYLRTMERRGGLEPPPGPAFAKDVQVEVEVAPYPAIRPGEYGSGREPPARTIRCYMMSSKMKSRICRPWSTRSVSTVFAVSRACLTATWRMRTRSSSFRFSSGVNAPENCRVL